MGGEHSGAITENGDLYMWGRNSSGQLGDGTTTHSLTPIKIMSNVKSVSLGGGHSGAITKNGNLYMWGSNLDGRLGDGTTTDSTTPIKITISTTSAYALSKSSESVSASGNYSTENFTDLLPNEVYNFYSMKTLNAENPFGSANLLYITQATTDENGNLSITYKSDESYDKPVNFVVPLKQTDLSTATVTMDSLICNGESQYVNPVVTLNGKKLVDSTDYYLSGDYIAQSEGSYTVTIKGRGLYTGELDFKYSVLGSGMLGDVNQDGDITIDDASDIQKHLAGITYLTEAQLKLADTNSDGEVTIDDVTHIQKYLADLIPSLSNA